MQRQYRLKRYNDPTNPNQYAIMNKFMIAKALGVRANALAQLFKPALIEIGSETCPLVIAELELKEGYLPVIIKTKLENGTFEYWHLDSDQHIYKDLIDLTKLNNQNLNFEQLKSILSNFDFVEVDKNQIQMV